MKIIKECSCGAPLTSDNFTPPVGRANKFGLPIGTLGNSSATFIGLKCKVCGNRYIAETKCGKYGGTMAMGRIIDNDLNQIAVEVKPEPVKPARGKASIPVTDDGYIQIDD